MLLTGGKQQLITHEACTAVQVCSLCYESVCLYVRDMQSQLVCLEELVYVYLIAQKQSAVMHSYCIVTVQSGTGRRNALALHLHQYMLLKAALAVLMQATSYGMH